MVCPCPFPWRILTRSFTHTTLAHISSHNACPHILTNERLPTYIYSHKHECSPIDSVVKTGAGSGLMERKGRLDSIISGLNYTLGEIPLTLKMRTGIHAGYLIAYIGILDNKRIAHNLVTKYHTVVDAITLHGRSQRQRYSRTADWGYIRECAGHATDASPDFCFLVSAIARMPS